MRRGAWVEKESRIILERSSGLRSELFAGRVPRYRLSVGTGGNRLGGPMQKALPEAASALIGTRKIGNLKELFPQFAETHVERFLLFIGADAEVEHVAGLLLHHPALRAARHIGVVPAEDCIADLQSNLC